eukprot:g2296.t1
MGPGVEPDFLSFFHDFGFCELAQKEMQTSEDLRESQHLQTLDREATTRIERIKTALEERGLVSSGQVVYFEEVASREARRYDARLINGLELEETRCCTIIDCCTEAWDLLLVLRWMGAALIMILMPQ